MSDFFAVISNVKIIKPMAGASVTIERSIDVVSAVSEVTDNG